MTPTIEQKNQPQTPFLHKWSITRSSAMFHCFTPPSSILASTGATLCIDCVNPLATILCDTYGLPLNQLSVSNEVILQMFAYFLQTFATIRFERRRNRLHKIFSFSMSGVLKRRPFQTKIGKTPNSQKQKQSIGFRKAVRVRKKTPHKRSPAIPHKHFSQRSQTGQAFFARQSP